MYRDLSMAFAEQLERKVVDTIRNERQMARVKAAEAPSKPLDADSGLVSEPKDLV